MDTVIICGAGWCGDTRATLRYLDELGVAYDYRDVDEDPAAAEWVKAQNGGKQKLPTLDVGGLILSIPSAAELNEALKAKGMSA
ncbi:MAG: glutaredoxin [Phycisphaerales bacterium]|nr:glutaredoxin [Phycisphaerales bacterium]